MKQYLFALKLVAAPGALAACLLAGAPALAASASSSAYDVSANLTLAGIGPITLGPINPVGGTAPPDYNAVNSVLSFNDSETFGVDTLTISSGILNASASGSTMPLSATALASIANLSVVLDAPLGVNLLTLTADLIQSTSMANTGGASGTANLTNVTLSGTLVGGSITLPPNPTANDVIYDLDGLEIVLNEQSPIGADGIMTNAVDVMFNNFLLGTVNGNIILSHTQAQVTGGGGGVPEPATWALMLVGVGLLGATVRRRKSTLAC